MLLLFVHVEIFKPVFTFSFPWQYETMRRGMIDICDAKEKS